MAVQALQCFPGKLACRINLQRLLIAPTSGNDVVDLSQTLTQLEQEQQVIGIGTDQSATLSGTVRKETLFKVPINGKSEQIGILRV